jgi:hypothetical protein
VAQPLPLDDERRALAQAFLDDGVALDMRTAIAMACDPRNAMNTED